MGQWRLAQLYLCRAEFVVFEGVLPLGTSKPGLVLSHHFFIQGCRGGGGVAGHISEKLAQTKPVFLVTKGGRIPALS